MLTHNFYSIMHKLYYCTDMILSNMQLRTWPTNLLIQTKISFRIYFLIQQQRLDSSAVMSLFLALVLQTKVFEFVKTILMFRFLLSNNVDFYIKSTLHFISVIASKCQDITFLLPFMRNHLSDLIEPIASEKVNETLIINTDYQILRI